MMTKIDELKEMAKTKIIGKILGDKSSEKIEPYNGENATYSSSDEEYEEFLKNLNVITSNSNENSEVFSVEDTHSFKLKKEEKNEVVDTPKEENTPTEEDDEDIPTRYMSAADDKIFTILTNVERLTNIVENNDIRKEHTLDKLLNELGSIKKEIEEVKKDQQKIQNNVSDINKVSDSVFDLKNAQQSAKNSINALETAFNRMKNKYITCITLLSILCFIIIALQVLNLIS